MLYIGLLVPYLGLHGHADLEERPLQFSVQHVDVLLHPLKIGNMREEKKMKNHLYICDNCIHSKLQLL